MIHMTRDDVDVNKEISVREAGDMGRLQPVKASKHVTVCQANLVKERNVAAIGMV